MKTKEKKTEFMKTKTVTQMAIDSNNECIVLNKKIKQLEEAQVTWKKIDREKPPKNFMLLGRLEDDGVMNISICEEYSLGDMYHTHYLNMNNIKIEL